MPQPPCPFRPVWRPVAPPSPHSLPTRRQRARDAVAVTAPSTTTLSPARSRPVSGRPLAALCCSGSYTWSTAPPPAQGTPGQIRAAIWFVWSCGYCTTDTEWRVADVTSLGLSSPTRTSTRFRPSRGRPSMIAPSLCDGDPQVQVAARPVVTLDPLAFQPKFSAGSDAGGDGHHQLLDLVAPHEGDVLARAGCGFGSGNDQVVSQIRAFLCGDRKST